MHVVRNAVTSLLEATHDGDATLAEWLDGLTAATRAVVPSAALVVAAIVQRHVDHWTLVAGDTHAHAIGPLADFGRMLPMVEPLALDAYYRRPERLATHSDIRARDPIAAGVGDGFVGMLGMQDSVALIAQASDGVSMVLFSLAEHVIDLTARDRLLLGRVSAHVEATLRTRVADQIPLAVLENDGKVTHAEGATREVDVRGSLTQHVRDVERSRTNAVRRYADQASDAWTALVLGRYGIVERTDGGRREYHVIAHPEHVWSGRELTNLEARVLELSARGMAGKVVAYSLGVSEAAVSGALGSAALKLGLASRNELVALAAQVLGPIAPPTPSRPLTTAERDVLASLRRGWTNTAIATARGASERTVANQIRSIMEKTGLGSRRALVALGPTHDEE